MQLMKQYTNSQKDHRACSYEYCDQYYANKGVKGKYRNETIA